jgi:hypothetical protein
MVSFFLPKRKISAKELHENSMIENPKEEK